MSMDNLKKEGKELSKAVENFLKTAKEEFSAKTSDSSTATESLKKGVTNLTSSIKTSIAEVTSEKELWEFDFSQMDMSSLRFYRNSGNLGTIIYEPANIFNSTIAIMRGNKNIAVPNPFSTSDYGILCISDISDLNDCFNFEPSLDTIYKYHSFMIDSIFPAKFKNTYGDYMELQKKGKIILNPIIEINNEIDDETDEKKE